MSERCEGCGSYVESNAVVCGVCNTPIGSSLGSGIDLDDPLFGGETGGPKLELDIERPTRRRPAARAPAPSPPSASGHPAPRGAGSEAGPARFERRDAPAPDPNAPSVYEISRAAKYPAPPPSFLGVIPYTISVLMRRRELQAEHADAQRLRAAAETAASDGLAKLGERALDRPELQEGLEAEVATVQSYLSEKEGVLASVAWTDEAFAAAQRGAEARLDVLRKELNPLRDRETRLSTTASMKQQDVARIQARLQRIDIELRNATSAEQQSALEAEKSAREGELRLATAPLQKASQELAELRRQLGDKTHEIAALEEELARGSEALQRDRAQRSQEAGEHERGATFALRALGEAARGRGVASKMNPAAAQDAERLVQAVFERRRVEEIQRRAVDAYDPPSFRKGAGVLGAGAFFILAMVIAAIAT